jgi:hypothetical protein
MTEKSSEQTSQSHEPQSTITERTIRALYMILFALVYQAVQGIVVLAAILQFLFVLFTGSSIAGFRELGARLALYNADIIEFMTYKSNSKPWPFASFPPGDNHIRGN